MAKFGKLTKLIKKWPSFTKNHHPTTESSSSVATSKVSKCDGDLQLVYVGKSRRPYMLSSNVINHPLVQELLDRSSRFIEERHDQKTVLVACEVVLFEHLLWMLEDSFSDHDDDDDREIGSVQELAEFYTY
ncbi:hypothetical protein Bca4012_094198 [Brassica carinata]|uniref:Uncharacterized protein n=4 Tax=Brassica TaxID=3705 RepID=A0A0D3DPZ4_BRAOL|nr:PREDICTED: uncharacterized protein LOC106311080 [Brassica oleracea var. oleracea]XP_013605917.1 PREDICTED: uncharacterized protein LOC106312806 [Brassica oleracea var. oleracea]XP_013682971.2 auxin-responsive protein SAUR77 [Brassica napus]KAG2257022.1 hypothetical protein Bca52824_076316 [Brassica carinata]VDD56186.1 unnamed protein product [Brassica oleracea]CAF2109132.1 unnamed protein product [Brassica napus]